MKPSDILSPAEIDTLGTRSNLVGAALVLHAWGLIAGAMALFAAWPNPLTFFLAVMVVGGRQLGLAILMHDAAHGLLFRTRRWNETIGRWFCAWPVFTDLHLYRPYHLKHHRHTQQAEDPDLILLAPFPITRLSLRRKIIRDLLGQTAFRRRGEQIVASWGPAGLSASERWSHLWKSGLAGSLVTNLILLAGLSIAGYWWLYPLLWLLPLATWYQLISRIRNIAEHALVLDNSDPLRNTRTTLAGPFIRLLLAPYWVNYHLEHHLFLFVPCWKLQAAHRLLVEKGLGARMELRRGYAEVLRMATSALADNPHAGSGPKTQHI